MKLKSWGTHLVDQITDVKGYGDKKKLLYSVI